MTDYTWTVEKSVAGIPIVICRDAKGEVVSKWSPSQVGVLTYVPNSRRSKWVRPRCPVPEMVTRLLAGVPS